MATRKGKKSVQVINRKGATQWAAAAVAAAAGLLAKQQLAQAGSDIWNSAAAPGTWGTAANWSVTSANIPPINGDDLTFNVGNGTYDNFDGTSANLLTSVGSITLTAAAGTTTFSGYSPTGNTQALTITGGGITNSSTNSVIFQELLAVGNNDSSAVFNAGTKTFSATNAAGFVVGSSSTLSLTGTSAAALISLASSGTTLGASSNLINTTATTSLAGPLSLLGGNGITIGSGTFNLGTTGVAGSGNFTDFGTGSTISIAGGTLATIPNAAQMSLGAGDIISISAGKFLPQQNGVVSFGAGGKFIATGGNSTLGANTELEFGSNSVFSVGGAASFSMGGGVMFGNSTSVFITGGTTSMPSVAPYVSLGNGVIVSVAGGTFTTGYQSWASGDILSVSGGNVTIGGNYVLSGTNDTISVSGGSLTASGFLISNSTVSVSAGTMALSQGTNPLGTFTVNVGSAISSTNSAVLRLTQATPYKGNFTIESGQTGAGTITIQNPNTGTGSTITTELVSALQLNNNATIVNLGTTGGTIIFDLNGGLSNTSDTTKTLTFDSSGNTNSELFNAGAAASNFLGSYSLRGGGTVSLTAAIPSFSSGKTLSGAGTWTQPAGTANTLVMAAGSTLNPGGYNGSSAGVLVITNNLSVAPASNLLFSLNGGNSSSAVAVGSTGTLFFGGTSSGKVNLSLNNVTLPPLNSSTTYELFSYGTYAGDPSADLTQDFSLTLNGATPDPSQTTLDVINNGAGSQIDVVVASVPEPASISLLGLGAVGLLGRRRKKVKAKA